MSAAASLHAFRAGPPPPRVALLADEVFFTRVVPVVPGATAAEVAAQVELALESLSPFPIAQLYHGHFWKPGLDRAFVFAAYRRRFTVEQTEAWPRAQLQLGRPPSESARSVQETGGGRVGDFRGAPLRLRGGSQQDSRPRCRSRRHAAGTHDH